MKENKKLSELDLLLKFYKDRLARQKNQTYGTCELDMGNNIDDFSVVYYFLCDLRGFSAFPKFVSDKEYDKIDKQSFLTLSSNGREYYHGFTDIKHGASYLWDPYYHYGEGDFGSGFYMTSNPMIAQLYTRELFSDLMRYNLPSKNRVLKARILSDNFSTYSELRELTCYLVDGNKDGYKIVHERNLKNNKMTTEQLKQENERIKMFSDLVEFIENIEDESLKRQFVKAFSSNFSAIGVYLGFDYIVRGINLDDNEEQIIVFNRGCLAVLDAEANRILEAAGGKYAGLNIENSVCEECDEIIKR